MISLYAYVIVDTVNTVTFARKQYYICCWSCHLGTKQAEKYRNVLPAKIQKQQRPFMKLDASEDEHVISSYESVHKIAKRSKPIFIIFWWQIYQGYRRNWKSFKVCHACSFLALLIHVELLISATKMCMCELVGRCGAG